MGVILIIVGAILINVGAILTGSILQWGDLSCIPSNLSAIPSSAQRTEWSMVRLTGMTHCAAFSGMEQFGSGNKGTVTCFTPPAIFQIFL